MNHRLVAVLSLVFVAGCAAEVRDSTALSREAWMWENVLRLRELSPTPQTRTVEFGVATGSWVMSYYVKDEGLLRIDDKEWVYIVTHSSHAGEYIGDISLAIDNRGQLYENAGHVCGGIDFGSKSAEAAKTSDDFFHRFQAPGGQWGLLRNPAPALLPAAIESLLDVHDYARILKTMPEVKRDWEKERAAIAPLLKAGAWIKRERIGSARLVVALPEAYGKYFDRVVEISCFNDSKITDLFLSSVSALAQLRALDLSGTAVTGEGLRHLKDLGKLDHLYLCETRLTPDAYRTLGELTALECVRVDGTPINDETLQHLKSLDNLREIWAFDTKITLEGVRQFRKSCPQARVILFPPGHPMKEKEEEVNKAPQ